METEKRLELIKQVGEEIVTEESLLALLDEKKNPIAYDGFEPSGQMHIAQGVLRAININKMTQAGVKFKMLVADWHGWANNKMGGDLEKIRTVGKYFIEMWKVCGLDMKNVEFLWVNDFVEKRDYWKTVMQVARTNTLKRITRCSQIMGRKESEGLYASHVLYPCMQCADIFHLKADITQLGMDQRKVNVLAREVGPKLGFWKPVIVSHHMLMGLGKPPAADNAEERAMALKMSKSKPDTAIFMTDSENEIKRKISKAYCPEGIAEENPILEYCKYMLFEKFDSLKIERPEKYGGDLEFKSYDELEDVFLKKELHPMDLKTTVSVCVDKLIAPVREHFEKNNKAKDLLEQVNAFKVTR